MSDFSVNTDKINNLADLLDKQVKNWKVMEIL